MDDTPRPPCPKCKSESVYRVIIDVIIEHVGKQRWHCATCKYEWPASEEDEQLDPSRQTHQLSACLHKSVTLATSFAFLLEYASP